MTEPVLDYDDVVRAASGLDGIANRTPVLTSRLLDEAVGARVFLKAECFQRSGSFKFRGAYTKLASLPEDERRRGVVAVSSGNHAAAVALAARSFRTSAVILMPHDAPAAKVAATRAYGAEIVTYHRYDEDRDERSAALVAERGLAFVRPFDDPAIMAGQGTAALELLDEVGDLDVLLVPCSGGGLLAGCSTVAKARNPRLQMIGVEPEAGDDTRQSLAAGRRVTISVPATIADGLQVPSPGELTFEVNRRLVDGVVVASDDEMRSAMAFAFDRLKVALEPSGAIGLAALLAGRVGLTGANRVGVILTGGNVGHERFCELLAGR